MNENENKNKKKKQWHFVNFVQNSVPFVVLKFNHKEHQEVIKEHKESLKVFKCTHRN
jgi:hypothetical protein